MTKQIIESILAPIRALIMRSRPAYKDYLGEETVEEKRVLVSGAFGKVIESSVTFTEGETYLVNLDGTEQEMAAQDVTLIVQGNSIGFSNIDMSKQIVVEKSSDGYDVYADISRANQTISVYHGETLILNCTMPSTGITDFSTVVDRLATLHDESFSGFVQGETYTIVAGEEAPVTGFVYGNALRSFELNSVWLIASSRSENVTYAEDLSESHTNFSISQNVTTVKKRYDIKLLPEDLLPKTVAKKADVQRAQNTANSAQSTASNAYSTASNAYSTANNAYRTANGLQSTAMANALWGDARKDTVMTLQISASGSGGTSRSDIAGCHLIPGERYTISASVYSSVQSAVWDGTQLSVGTGSTEFKILWEPDVGKYRLSFPSGATGLISITGHCMSRISRAQNVIKAKTLAPYVVFPELNFVSRTGDSDKFVRMQAYDGPRIQIYDGKNYANLATQEYADGKALGMDITGASAGQIIKIKSVDANGKPTEWESVDIVNAAPVRSVNGKTGAVNLTATDVGALPDTTEIPSKTSELDNDSNFATTLQVNTKYTKPSAGIPKTDLAADVQNSLDKADTALQSAPVTSVAGKTGAVTLAKSDVGLGNVDNISVNTRMNRTTNVNASDTNYTTYMARGEALFSSKTTPTVNGCIAWKYE